MSGVGKFRHMIDIEVSTEPSDGQGGATTPTWAAFRSKIWSSIKPVSARQIDFGQSLEHRVTHRICFRFFPGLTSDMRVAFENRIFHIHKIRDLEERKRYYEIEAIEGAPS